MYRSSPVGKPRFVFFQRIGEARWPIRGANIAGKDLRAADANKAAAEARQQITQRIETFDPDDD